MALAGWRCKSGASTNSGGGNYRCTGQDRTVHGPDARRGSVGAQREHRVQLEEGGEDVVAPMSCEHLRCRLRTKERDGHREVIHHRRQQTPAALGFCGRCAGL